MKKSLLLVAVLLFLVSCGTYREAVQVDDHAYLLLIGDPSGNVVVIDNNKPIDLGRDTSSFSLNGKQATKLEISKGTHTVKITRDGKVMVNRKFYVSTGTSFEVKL